MTGKRFATVMRVGAQFAYIGLDIHRDTIAVAIADTGRGAPRDYGVIPNREPALRSLVRKLARRPDRLFFCYEAGPTGFGTYHSLTRLGATCEVVAPSLIPKGSMRSRVAPDRKRSSGRDPRGSGDPSSRHDHRVQS